MDITRWEHGKKVERTIKCSLREIQELLLACQLAIKDGRAKTKHIEVIIE